MHKWFRRILMITAVFLFALMHVPWHVRAGGTEVRGPEYSDYYKGVFPTEITFADTGANESPADYASVLSDLSGPGVTSADAHYFTAHPGERFQFTLSSPAMVSRSLLRLNMYGSAVLTEKGSYAVFWKRQYLEVKNFGFDTDLSDCSGEVVLVMKGYCVQISDNQEMDPDNERRNLFDTSDIVNYREYWDEMVPIEVRASGKAGLVPLSDLWYYYALDSEQKEDVKTLYYNSVGFEFELQPESDWEITIDNSPASFPSRPLLSMGTDEHNEEFYQNQQYVTPVIVLIDSDLHPRGSLPVERIDFTEFKEKNEEGLEHRDLEGRKRWADGPENEEGHDVTYTPVQSRPASSGGRVYTLTNGSLTYPTKDAPSRVPVAVLLAALSAGASALLAASAGNFGVSDPEEEILEEEAAADCKITVNDGRDMPYLLSGSEQPVSVSIQLTGAKEDLVLWTAAVLPDPDVNLKERLACLHVSCAGDSLSARLVMQCEKVPEEFHATIRVSAAGMQSKKLLATEVCNVTVKNTGIYERTEKGKTSVVLVKEGSMKGTAEETVLEEGDYTREVLEDGTIRYELKEEADHEDA